VAERLSPPGGESGPYGVGFVGVHDGRAGNFIFLDWWEQENELHHHVSFSSQEQPTAITAARTGDPIACT